MQIKFVFALHCIHRYSLGGMVDTTDLKSVPFQVTGSSPVVNKKFGDIVQLVERMLCKHEVIGSSPIISNFFWVISSVGRASALQADCPWFDSEITQLKIYF